jgi:hypothetical protein
MTQPPAFVTVRLLSDPSLWCWSIVDARSGRVVEDSWTADWAGFDSREAAREAGLRRLAARPVHPAEALAPVS